MILSAPLTMFGMEEAGVSSPVVTTPVSRAASPKNLVQSELNFVAVDANAPVSTSRPATPQNLVQAEDKNAKTKKLVIATAAFGISTGLSFVAQAYDKSGATRTPHFVKAQYAGVLATATTGSMAAYQAHKANPEFIGSVVNNATTFVSNVATSFKDLCTFKKGEQTSESKVVEISAAATAAVAIVATPVTEDVK